MYENLLANVPTDLWIGGNWRRRPTARASTSIDPSTETSSPRSPTPRSTTRRPRSTRRPPRCGGWAARSRASARESSEGVRADHREARAGRAHHPRERQVARRRARRGGLRRRVLPLVRRGGRPRYRQVSRPPSSAPRISSSTSRSASPCSSRRGTSPRRWRPARSARRSPPAARSSSSRPPRRRSPRSPWSPMLEAGVPAGVLNVVPSAAPGRSSSAMLHDPRVRVLSFTGSTEVGRTLLHAGRRPCASAAMELGGNAPFIVFDDADLDAALDGAMIAKMRNGGEACTAANRFFVARKVHDAFVEGLAPHGPAHGRPRHRGRQPARSARRRRCRRQGRSLVDDAVRGRPGGHRRRGAGRPGLLLPAHRPRRRPGRRPGAAARRSSARSRRSDLRDRGRRGAMANDTEFGLVAYLYTATSPAACGCPRSSRAAWSASTAASSPTPRRRSAAPSRADSAAKARTKASSSSWRPTTSRSPGNLNAAPVPSS